MKIIIDGYNLIKFAMGVSHVPSARIEQFLKLISRFAKNRNHKVIVVFDGGDTNFPFCETKYGIDIIYSGYKESADDVIGRYVSERRGQEMFVVTSDKEVANFAAACGVDILKSDEFYELLKALGVNGDLSATDSRVHKIVESQDEELDALMEFGSEQVQIKEEGEILSRESNPRKKSKAERKKQRKIKKL